MSVPHSIRHINDLQRDAALRWLFGEASEFCLDRSYSNNAIVEGSDDLLYRSLTEPNLGNDPVSDGGVNWQVVDTDGSSAPLNGDFYTESGIADAYVLDTTTETLTQAAYLTGMLVRAVAGNTNTGASTVNVNGIGVQNIKLFGEDPTAGDIVSGEEFNLVYDGTDFQIIPFVSKSHFTDVKSGRKNILINGGFSVQQRGTSFPAGAAEYTLDRWHRESTTLQVDASTMTIGGDVFDAIQLTKTVSAAPASINQPIELLRVGSRGPLSGFHIVQFFAQNGVGTRTVGVSAQWDDGSAHTNAQSCTVTTIGSNVATTTPQLFTFLVDLDSASPVGTNTSLSIFIGTVASLNAGQNIKFAQCQAEKGTVATDFEYRQVEGELGFCQRYYIQDPGLILLGQTGRTTFQTLVIGNTAFPSEMRVTPTVILGSSSNVSGLVDTERSPRTFTMTGTPTSAVSTASVNGYTADAEL